MGLYIDMNTKKLSQEYWDARHRLGDTPWDIGYAAPALVHYFTSQDLHNKKILIPGAGLGHEAQWLAEHFPDSQITVLDISPSLIDYLENEWDAYSHIQLVCGDFFEHQGQYDFIMEQTFFCALNPELREKYFQKMNELLVPGGRLAGLWFHCDFDQQGPPFGGNAEDYLKECRPYFTEFYVDFRPESIAPRKEREVFMELKKSL